MGKLYPFLLLKGEESRGGEGRGDEESSSFVLGRIKKSRCLWCSQPRPMTMA